MQSPASSFLHLAYSFWFYYENSTYWAYLIILMMLTWTLLLSQDGPVSDSWDVNTCCEKTMNNFKYEWVTWKRGKTGRIFCLGFSHLTTWPCLQCAKHSQEISFVHIAGIPVVFWIMCHGFVEFWSQGMTKGNGFLSDQGWFNHPCIV